MRDVGFFLLSRFFPQMMKCRNGSLVTGSGGGSCEGAAPPADGSMCGHLWMWPARSDASCCNALQRITAQRSAAYRGASQRSAAHRSASQRSAAQRSAPHRTALQRSAPHCSAPHRTAARRSAMQRIAARRSALQRIVAYCSASQRLAAVCLGGLHRPLCAVAVNCGCVLLLCTALMLYWRAAHASAGYSMIYMLCRICT